MACSKCNIHIVPTVREAVKGKIKGKITCFPFAGQPTVVYFHVTVMTLDSINEESMVRKANGVV